MAMEVSLVAQLLNDTLSPDSTVVHTATESLDRFSHSPHFPFSLLSISTGSTTSIYLITSFKTTQLIDLTFVFRRRRK